MNASGRAGVYVILPCYNETAAAVRPVVASLVSAGYQVVLVDDGSVEPVCGLVADFPVHCLRHAVNLGQGAALQTGMVYCRQCGADAVVHADADGQHELSCIPALLDALEHGADVALGSRFLRETDRAAVPPGRRMLLRAARMVNGLLTGLWLSDAHNGFRALNARALACMDLEENRMAHATEILEQIRTHGLRVTEVPVTVHYTPYSRAKGQRWTASVTILFDWILHRLFR